MFATRKTITVILLVMLVTAGVAAVSAPARRHKNLKILPQDISDAKLDSIMQSYRKALGIGCGFCHVPMQNLPDSLDYASDANEMKENARRMMRMTIDLNKNYFNFDSTQRPEYINVIHCKMCHQGEPYPLH